MISVVARYTRESWRAALLGALLLSNPGCNRHLDNSGAEAVFGARSEVAIRKAEELVNTHRYKEAETAFRAALSAVDAEEGRGSAAYAVTLDELGIVYLDQGRTADARETFDNAVQVFTRFAPDDRVELAHALNDLGYAFYDEANYSKANESFEQAISLWQKSLPAGDPRLLVGLNNIANMSRKIGQTSQSESLYRSALAREVSQPARSDPALARQRAEIQVKTLNNLGLLLFNVEAKYQEAEPLLLQSLHLGETRLGRDDPLVAETLSYLGLLYDDTRRLDVAEADLKRAYAIDQRIFGNQSQATAQVEYDLGRLCLHAGRCADAAQWLRQSVTTREKVLGLNHPELGTTLCRLGASLACTGPANLAEAANDYERARQILLNASRLNGQFDDRSVAGIREYAGGPLEGYLPLLARIGRLQPDKRVEAGAKAFSVADQLRSGPADAALSKAAARAMISNSRTLASFTRVQDLRLQVQATRSEFLNRSRSGDSAPIAEARDLPDRLRSLEEELDRRTAELFRDFPQYAEILAPSPITVSQLQSLLRSDETLVAYYMLDDTLEVWVVPPGKGSVAWFQVPVPRKTITEMIARLRASLSLQSPYDVDDAYSLYQLILKPIRPLLKSNRIVVVMDRTTLPIPFGALITDNRGSAFSTLEQRYRQGLAPSPQELGSLYPRLHWFFDQGFTMSFLPSATSLRYLRSRDLSHKVPVTSQEPFIGFGDPLLTGAENEQQGSMVRLIGVGVAAQIRALPRLPGTRGELMTEARLLGADPSQSVFLGDRATRSNVLALNQGRLNHTRVVSFATHALMGGDLSTLQGPALVLTPPAHPTDQDVGLLTLDDILSLRVGSSDWIILSACNTASANGDGFSGLTRGFFFAGGRSLLVSQWNVDDRATLELMINVMNAYVKSGRSSRAEALRSGMLNLKNPAGDSDLPAGFAHPAAWAPFFIVGEP